MRFFIYVKLISISIICKTFWVFEWIFNFYLLCTYNIWISDIPIWCPFRRLPHIKQIFFQKSRKLGNCSFWHWKKSPQKKKVKWEFANFNNITAFHVTMIYCQKRKILLQQIPNITTFFWVFSLASSSARHHLIFTSLNLRNRIDAYSDWWCGKFRLKIE